MTPFYRARAGAIALSRAAWAATRAAARAAPAQDTALARPQVWRDRAIPNRGITSVQSRQERWSQLPQHLTRPGAPPKDAAASIVGRNLHPRGHRSHPELTGGDGRDHGRFSRGDRGRRHAFRWSHPVYPGAAMFASRVIHPSRATTDSVPAMTGPQATYFSPMERRSHAHPSASGRARGHCGPAGPVGGAALIPRPSASAERSGGRRRTARPSSGSLAHPSTGRQAHRTRKPDSRGSRPAPDRRVRSRPGQVGSPIRAGLPRPASGETHGPGPSDPRSARGSGKAAQRPGAGDHGPSLGSWRKGRVGHFARHVCSGLLIPPDGWEVQHAAPSRTPPYSRARLAPSFMFAGLPVIAPPPFLTLTVEAGRARPRVRERLGLLREALGRMTPSDRGPQ
jgi:hypothetical protein